MAIETLILCDYQSVDEMGRQFLDGYQLTLFKSEQVNHAAIAVVDFAAGAEHKVAQLCRGRKIIPVKPEQSQHDAGQNTESQAQIAQNPHEGLAVSINHY